MKKQISILLTMLLLVTAVLSGCGDGKGTSGKDVNVAGNWKATVDCTELMADEMAEIESMLGTASDFKFNIDIDVTFNGDGTYAMNMNEDSFKAAVDTLFDDVLMGGLEQMIERQIADNGLDMSVEEFMELAQLDVNSLLEEGKKEALSGLEGLNPMLEGSYALKDGLLYLTDGDGDPLSLPETEGCKITLNGDTLTLSAPASISEDEKFMFPMELKKVK